MRRPQVRHVTRRRASGRVHQARLAAWFLAASLAITLSPRAGAQETDGCLPLEPGSADRAADRLGLDEDQTLWLLARFLEERIRAPEDLDGMPGAGTELREALSAAFCWGEPWRGGITVAGRRSGASARDEARMRWARGALSLDARWQRRPEAASLRRAALDVGSHGWRGAAGSLEGRFGFGLGMGFPEARASGVRRARGGAWRSSLSADPGLPWGFAVKRTVKAWEAGILAARFPGGGWGGGAAIAHTRGATTLGSLAARREGGFVTALGLDGRTAGGWGWGWEWARTRAGSAWGANWRFGESTWRIEASALRRGRGFESPFASALDAGGDPDEALELALSVRRLSREGRFLRFGLLESRRPDRSWGRARRSVELELGERLTRGVDLVLLGRARADGDEGTRLARERLARGEIRGRFGGWSLRLRGEEKLEGTAAGRLVAVVWEGGRRVRWELRAARIALEPAATPFAWYRQRAGGLYGWDRIGDGTAFGGWGRVPMGPCAVEVSADGGERGWEGSLAVTAALGSP